MKTETQLERELFEARQRAQREIHQTLLPAFIQCAASGHSARALLAWMDNAREGLAIAAAFGMSGADLAENLRSELSERAMTHAEEAESRAAHGVTLAHDPARPWFPAV